MWGRLKRLWCEHRGMVKITILDEEQRAAVGYKYMCSRTCYKCGHKRFWFRGKL